MHPDAGTHLNENGKAVLTKCSRAGKRSAHMSCQRASTACARVIATGVTDDTSGRRSVMKAAINDATTALTKQLWFLFGKRNVPRQKSFRPRGRHPGNIIIRRCSICLVETFAGIPFPRGFSLFALSNYFPNVDAGCVFGYSADIELSSRLSSGATARDARAPLPLKPRNKACHDFCS